MKKVKALNLDSVKGTLQQLAGAMMVPIIVLVLAGLCVGFFSPLSMLIFEKGTFLHSISTVISKMGTMIMGNLPFWFTIGVAFGLAKKEKGWAAFSAMVMFMLVNTAIGTYAACQGWTADTTSVAHLTQKLGWSVQEATRFSKLWTNVGGIFTLDTSIFGGLVSGIVTAVIHNKWHSIKLPNAFSYFSGPRFIIMISPIFATIIGVTFYYSWPVIANGIGALGEFISKSGLVGTFVYGISDRTLLPVGLHHLITLPIRYTEVGGSMLVDGVLYNGTTNIDTALVASSTATELLIRNFTSGRLLTNLGALPGAALAMYMTAKKENRKKVAAILIPTVATALFVGITEPIEFTILFSAPLLYFLVHVPLSGLAFVLTELTRVSIQGFALLFMIPNLLQPQKVHAMSLIILIPLFFALYYFIFKWAILKWDIKTPGRKDSNEDVKLVSKKDFKNKKSNKVDENKEMTLASKIIEAFGDKINIISVENCATRLRVAVKDSSLVASNDVWTEEMGAMGVVRNGDKFQIIFGPKVTTISSEVKDYLDIN